MQAVPLLGTVVSAVGSLLGRRSAPKPPAPPPLPAVKPSEPAPKPTETGADQAKRQLLAAAGTGSTFLTGRRGALVPDVAVGKQRLGD